LARDGLRVGGELHRMPVRQVPLDVPDVETFGVKLKRAPILRGEP